MDEGEIVKRRTLVPRWRNVVQTPDYELQNAHQTRSERTAIATNVLTRALLDWERERNPVNSAELRDAISLAGSDGRLQKLLPHIGYVRSGKASNVDSSFGRKSAEDWMNAHFQAISTLKRRIIYQPRDMIASVELARSYIQIGQPRAASAAMERALKLGSNNRYVLRCAARLFVHIGDEERASRVIARSSLVRVDPWIMATEVALSTLINKAPRWGVKETSSLISEKRINRNYSELASALGVLETLAGSNKKAKKLLRRSLDNPTENVVAQAQWMETTHHFSFPRMQEVLSVDQAYEARTLHLMGMGDTAAASKNAELWLTDEPYSLRAAAHGSYVNLALADDLTKGLYFAIQGLVANPKNFGLLNNKAYAEIRLGRMKDAQSTIADMMVMMTTDRHRVYCDAILGLMAFNSGSVDEGRYHYIESLQKASKIDGDMQLGAIINWFEQEFSAGSLPDAECRRIVHLIDKKLEKASSSTWSLAQIWEGAKRRTVDRPSDGDKLLGTYRGIKIVLPAVKKADAIASCEVNEPSPLTQLLLNDKSS